MVTVTIVVMMALAILPGGGYSHILAIRVCAAGKGMVFKSFSLA